jgi:hypothetical protein
MSTSLQIPSSLTEREPISPAFLVPFDRDDKFIDRPDLFSEIDKRVKLQRRVALAGIGGVGYVVLCSILSTASTYVLMFYI